MSSGGDMPRVLRGALESESTPSSGEDGGESAATRGIADLPGPRGLPVAGNALQLRPDRLHLTLERWAGQYGPTFRFGLGPRTVVAFAGPDAINAILRDRPDGFRRWREIQEVAHEAGVHGVFSAEGADWRRQRRLAVTALNTHHLHRYFEVIRVCAERLHARLASAADTGEPVDLKRAFRAFTTDVTSWLAFGHDLNTLQRDSELQVHIQRVLTMVSRHITAPVPYWRYLKWPADRAGERSLDALRTAVDGFIARARARMDARPELYERPENFLEGVLAAQREGRYSDQEVFANTFTMLLAGEDTTAQALSWTAWFIARDPALQRRLADAARTALGDTRVPASVDVATSFAYGEAVLLETMRLKSPAPMLFVEPLKDTSVSGVELPRGTRVILLTRYAAMHDSRAFDPQREREPKRLLNFGAGPRFCPGRNLALLEARVALAMLARGFELALHPGAPPVRERLAFTMQPTGLRVLLRERQ
jgi:cytochrome P450